MKVKGHLLKRSIYKKKASDKGIAELENELEEPYEKIKVIQNSLQQTKQNLTELKK